MLIFSILYEILLPSGIRSPVPYVGGGGGGGARSLKVSQSVCNSKTPQDIEKKLCDSHSSPLRVILHILSITIMIRYCHVYLLLLMCNIIFWNEKVKTLDNDPIKLKCGREGYF